MKWTNKDRVSPIIAAAIMNDPYDPGDCDITVTQLIDSPYVRHQRMRPEMANVEVEFSSRIYALLGKLIHGILETGLAGMDDNQIMEVVKATGIAYEDLKVEERLFATDKGWTWSGQYDLNYSQRKDGRKVWVLEDHKLCSVGEFSAQRGEDKWTHQLNLLALLVRRNGGTVDELAINAYFRDWSKMRAVRDKSGEYPPRQHVRIMVDLWPQNVQQAYLEARMAAHQAEPVQPCTPEERWERNPKWRVLPLNAKRGRLFDSRGEADQYVAMVITRLAGRLSAVTTRKATTPAQIEKKKADRAKLQKEVREMQRATIELVGGFPIRCNYYCEAAAICHFHQEQKNRA